jgi:dynein regulatory complex protein 1
MDREGEGEPQTREERIKKRRQRLESKMEARKLGTEEGKLSKEQEEKPLGKGEQQIFNSRKKLDHLKTVGMEEVTKFRIETDVAENERRIAEEGQRENRLQKKHDEAASSNKRNASVQMKWQALYEKTIPQDLLKEINAQKEACDKIIHSKDRLIAEFQQELKQKDEDYVKALKKQAEDIDRLISTMHQQTKALIGAYEEELAEIETAFMLERRELLTSNKDEITSLIQQRQTKELQNRKAREDKIELEQNNLDQIHEGYAESYNILKMKLQKEIQGLEQQLEEMRALYQLNAEKLEYNLRVLSERVKENEKAIQHHKRKLARLQDVLSGLITKYADTDKKFQHENNILTEQYRRITEQYKDLQLKFQYFEQADTDKYQKVWEMNEKEAMELVNTCIKADRVVFEQQLGVEWKPPVLNFWSDTDYAEDKEKLVDDSGHEGEEEKELSDMAKRMLEMLCSQCSFLVEERVKKVVEKLEQEDRMPKKIESILKALSVESQGDINKMLAFFQRSLDNEDHTTTIDLIDPQDAIVALRNFIEYQTKNASLQTSKKNQMLSLEERLKDKRRREEHEFWRRMAQVIPERNYRIWHAFEKGLEKYIVLLQDRSKLIEETDTIRHQNDELRSLLNQYMSAKINEELFSPPQLMVAAPAATQG